MLANLNILPRGPRDCTFDDILVIQNNLKSPSSKSASEEVRTECNILHVKNPAQIIFNIYAYSMRIYVSLSIAQMIQMLTDHTGQDDIVINSHDLHHDRH